MNSYCHASLIKIYSSFYRCVYLKIFETEVIILKLCEYKEIFADFKYLLRTFNIRKLF